MSWIERAYVGQKVVCVDDDWNEIGESGGDSGTPSVLEICTIYEVLVLTTGAVALELKEYPDYGFEAAAFKPAKDTTLQVEAIKRAALNIPEHV